MAANRNEKIIVNPVIDYYYTITIFSESVCNLSSHKKYVPEYYLTGKKFITQSIDW